MRDSFWDIARANAALRALHARLDALEALVGDALHALLAQVERLRVVVALTDERVDLLRLGAAHRANVPDSSPQAG